MPAIIDVTAVKTRLVTTSIGDVPEEDLEIRTFEEDAGDVWVMARECKYVGIMHPEAVGTIVRRDAWVTMKTGQAASAEAST